jgi:dihydrofolate reductase
LEEVDWGQWEKPKLIKENLAEEIAKLRAQPGKNVGVGGSPTLVRSLLQDGLVDQLTLMIHPVILGKGKRLFTEDLDLKKLQLVDSKVTGTGIVILTYQPPTSENEK